jgi:dCTP deaminase
VIVSTEEFNEVMDFPEEYGLYRGAAMGDEEVLRAMELGWIKVWTPGEDYNVLDYIDADNIDFRLGKDFWQYHPSEVSRLTIGEHIQPIQDHDILTYTYKLPGEEFIFFPNNLVLAMTVEHISLSNVIRGQFDGRSLAARLGLSNHQAAGHFHPGFTGPMMAEISNANILHGGVRVHDRIGSMTFSMLGSPSTRPRTQKENSESKADNQQGPFGFWDPKWDEEREKVIGRSSREKLDDQGSISAEELYDELKRVL